MPVSCAPPYRFYVWLPWVCLVSLLCLDVYQYGLRVTGFEPFLQIYLLGFGLSHPLAKKIGPWPAVLTVTAAAAGASYLLVDRD